MDTTRSDSAQTLLWESHVRVTRGWQLRDASLAVRPHAQLRGDDGVVLVAGRLEREVRLRGGTTRAGR